MNYQEYEQFANEWDELVGCECIPNGIFKGLPIDHQIDMNYEQAAVYFAETVAAHYQRMEDNAIEAACKGRGCLSEAYEDKWPEA